MMIRAGLKAIVFLISGVSVGTQAAPLLTPPPPVIAAKAYIVNDFYSGHTLASASADQRIAPASLTKLMTAYLSFRALREGRIKLDQTVPVSTRAWRAEGSRMFIDPKVPVSVQDLIRGVIIQSGNDASVALSEAIAGAEEVFVQMMNQQAMQLGMKQTHFLNATGLPHPNHTSTVRDLAVLAAAIIRDFPEYFPLYSIKEFTYNKVKQFNRNSLLWTTSDVDGIKTGYTDSAGYCLIATMHRDGRRVISVVAGAASEAVRATESLKLLNYALQFFETPRLYAKNQVLHQVPVWKGTVSQIPTGLRQDFYLTLPRGAGPRLKAQFITQQPLLAPVHIGQTIGKIALTLDGKPFGSYPVFALATVERAGFFGRMWDSLRLLFS